MEQLFIYLTIIFGAISLGQFLKIRKMEKGWSPNADWYNSNILRSEKEGFINNVISAFDEKNIDFEYVLQSLSLNKQGYNDIANTLMKSLPLVDFYRPEIDGEVDIDNQKSYLYTVGRNRRMHELLSSFGKQSLLHYSYSGASYKETFLKLLESNSVFKDRDNFNKFIMLVVKDKKFYYTEAFNFSPNDEWWVRGMYPIHNIGDDGLSDWVEKGTVLFLPKIIE